MSHNDLESINESQNIKPSDRAYVYALKYDVKFTMTDFKRYLKKNHPYVEIVSDNSDKKRYVYVYADGYDIEKIVVDFIIKRVPEHFNGPLEDSIKESIANNLDIIVNIEDKDDGHFIVEFTK